MQPLTPVYALLPVVDSRKLPPPKKAFPPSHRYKPRKAKQRQCDQCNQWTSQPIVIWCGATLCDVCADKRSDRTIETLSTSYIVWAGYVIGVHTNFNFSDPGWGVHMIQWAKETAEKYCNKQEERKGAILRRGFALTGYALRNGRY